MKSILLLIAIGLGVACGDTIPEWVTATGKHYKEVDVLEIKPDGLSIRHQDGVARIPFDELTPAQRDTYHLTDQGRADYEKRKREEALQSAEAARSKADSQAPAPADSQAPADSATSVPTVALPSVRYVTVDEIKRAWAAAMSIPRTLDKNYKSLMRSRADALRAIASGSRDREAEKKAAQINKDLALKAGDNARAAVEEQTLARISREEDEIARRRQEDEHQRQILAANEAAYQPQPPVIVYEDPPYNPSPPCPPPVVSHPSPPVYHPPVVVAPTPPPESIPPKIYPPSSDGKKMY